MNTLNVTGILSRPRWPFGQPTPLSVPHAALRMLGAGRAIEPAAVAVMGNAHTRITSPAKRDPGRRCIDSSCIDIKQREREPIQTTARQSVTAEPDPGASSLTAATGITAVAIGISNAHTTQLDDAVREAIAASCVGIVPILRPMLEPWSRRFPRLHEDGHEF